MFRLLTLRLHNVRNFWTLFWILICLHQLYFGWFLVRSSFVPYVTDGNETFSVWWHAHNLYTFSFWKSFGLTDEAYGLTEASHPFFHTHQGNMPRLFGFLIYALGARRVEAQVLITTLIIGNLTLFFCYAAVARVTRPAIAFLFCLFLFSDYLLYAQWHVVTYRVWYGLLFFGTLFAISSTACSTKAWPYALLGTLFFLLFYFELVFAAYVSLLCGMFALWQQWGNPRRIAAIYLVQFAGGAAALVLLVFQLKAALGLDVVVKDFSSTFLARNASTGKASGSALVDFFHGHNIVFWQNFMDGALLRTPSAFVHSISASVFQIWSPPFFLLVTGPLIGILISFLERKTSQHAVDPARPQSGRLRKFALTNLPIAGSSSTVVWFGGALAVFAGAVLIFEIFRPGRIFGVELAGSSFELWAALFAVAAGPTAALFAGYIYEPAMPAAICRSIWKSWPVVIAIAIILVIFEISPGWFFERTVDWQRLPAISAVAAIGISTAALLIGALGASSFVQVGRGGLACSLMAIMVSGSHHLFDQSDADIWLLPFGDWKVRAVVRVAMLLTSGGGIAIAACGAKRSFGLVARAGVGRTLVLILLGLASYSTIYLVSPGYILSGYTERLAPFAIFFLAGIPAIATYAMSVAGGRLCYWLSKDHDRARQIPGRSLAPPCLVFAVVALLVIWAKVQVYYARILPPDHASFARTLALPPFRNATFAVGNYAAPVAYYTQGWAYIDMAMGEAEVDPAGQRLRDPKALWLADWSSNPAYERPIYYACMKMPNFESVLALRDPARFGDRFSFCDREPIFGEQNPFADRRLASDFAQPRFWAIARLGSARPKIGGPSTIVNLHENQWVVSAAIEGIHDPAQPVRSKTFELHAKEGAACEADIGDSTTVQTSNDGSDFELPSSFQGLIQLRAKIETDVGGSDWKRGDSWRLISASAGVPASASRCPSILVDGGFGAGGLALRREGWSSPEPWGTWTIGPRSSLSPMFVPNAARHSDFLVEATTRAFVPNPERPQAVTVRANGVVVANWRFSDSEPGHVVTAAVPSSVLERQSALSLSFDISNPISPASVGSSADQRPLGLGLMHLKIREMER
jgi:hypothetical protein